MVLWLWRGRFSWIGLIIYNVRCLAHNGGKAMTIEQRLEKLERQNRMFKIIIVAISLGCAAIAAAGGSAGEDKVIMAREFRLIDSQGKTLGPAILELTLPAPDNLDVMRKPEARNPNV